MSSSSYAVGQKHPLNVKYEQLKQQINSFEKTAPSVQDIQKTKQALENTLNEIEKIAKKNDGSPEVYTCALAQKKIPELIAICVNRLFCEHVDKLRQLSALYDAPAFSQEDFIAKFSVLTPDDQNNLKVAICREAGKPLHDNNFGGDSVNTRASEKYVRNAVRRYVNIQAAREFQGVLNSQVKAFLIKNTLGKLPVSLQDKMKLGFWIFEGMPKEDTDLGKSFFLENPRSETVRKVVGRVIANDGRLFSDEEYKELTTIKQRVETRDAVKIKEGFSALPVTAELIKKSIWVAKGRPLDKGADFSGDLIRNNPLDPSIKAVVDSLATLGLN